MTNWSPKQVEALDAAGRWLRSGSEQVFHLFGFAGTGKTTLARHLAESCRGSVLFGAYTGKAAHVLRTKGCHNATTVHRLIYSQRPKSTSHITQMREEVTQLMKEMGDEHPRVIELLTQLADMERKAKQPNFIVNPDSEVRDANLVVLDECSMVDGRMGEDLLSFGCKVLVLGDPMQLPPVAGEGYFTKDVRPQILLDEIHRQAAESPVIALATKVRNGESIDLGTYGETIVTDQRLSEEFALTHDQVIVGRNATRHKINKRTRSLLGFSEDLPMTGDRIICLKNNHDVGLLNGAIFYVDEFVGSLDDKMELKIHPEENVEERAEHVIHAQPFFGEEVPFFEIADAEMFAFGYGITCHKSQGSQFKRPMVIDESYCFKQNRHRWLYTAITRAEERVTIVRS